MVKIMKKRNMFFLLTGVVFLLAACSKSQTQPGTEGNLKPTIITAAPTKMPEEEPTATPVPTLTSTPVPTPTPTLTPTPTVTPTPEPTATPTPEPTMMLVPESFSVSEKIPAISIITENSQPILSKEEYVNCSVTLYNTEAKYALQEEEAGIRVRGNSSSYYWDVEAWKTKEVPYRIKFEEKTNLLGLNDGAKCKSWVLLRTDDGLIRDEIAFRMGSVLLGENNYSSDSQLVHLYVNEEFKGLFLLCEQSQVNKHRVDVYEPKKDETGTKIGYLLEIDNYANINEHPCFRMEYENAEMTDIEGVTDTFQRVHYTIKSDITSQEQVDFISSYTINLFKLVYEACEKGNYLTFDENYNLVPASFDNAKDTVDAVLNLDSVVGSYILEEIMDDQDCGAGSFFMCIDFSEESKYPKLTFTCPWDYNWTCMHEPQGEYYAAAFDTPEFEEKYGDRSHPWFILLMKQDWFVELVKEKWTQVRQDGLLEACIQGEKAYIDEYRTDINKKWSYAADAGYVILGWIERRIAWLDEEWLNKE